MSQTSDTPQNTASLRILVCTSCRPKFSDSRPGAALIRRIRTALENSPLGLGNDFKVSGVACMAGCTRPCTVGFQGKNKPGYLFGDINPAIDVAGIIDFAKDFRNQREGWCPSVDAPGKLRRPMLSRMPAINMDSETLKENET